MPSVASAASDRSARAISLVLALDRARVEDRVCASTAIRPLTTAVPLSAEMAACGAPRIGDEEGRLGARGRGRGRGRDRHHDRRRLLAQRQADGGGRRHPAKEDPDDGTEGQDDAGALEPDAHDEVGAAARALGRAVGQGARAGRAVEDVGVDLADGERPRFGRLGVALGAGCQVRRHWITDFDRRARAERRAPASRRSLGKCAAGGHARTQPDGPGDRPVRSAAGGGQPRLAVSRRWSTPRRPRPPSRRRS